MNHTLGPCETLARLAIQSDRYNCEFDFAEAVDAVLNHPEYDAAPDLLAACESAVEKLRAAGDAVEYLQDNHRSVGPNCDCWGCMTARRVTIPGDDLLAAIAKARGDSMTPKATELLVTANEVLESRTISVHIARLEGRILP